MSTKEYFEAKLKAERFFEGIAQGKYRNFNEAPWHE